MFFSGDDSFRVLRNWSWIGFLGLAVTNGASAASQSLPVGSDGDTYDLCQKFGCEKETSLGSSSSVWSAVYEIVDVTKDASLEYGTEEKSYCGTDVAQSDLNSVEHSKCNQKIRVVRWTNSQGSQLALVETVPAPYSSYRGTQYPSFLFTGPSIWERDRPENKDKCTSRLDQKDFSNPPSIFKTQFCRASQVILAEPVKEQLSRTDPKLLAKLEDQEVFFFHEGLEPLKEQKILLSDFDRVRRDGQFQYINGLLISLLTIGIPMGGSFVYSAILPKESTAEVRPPEEIFLPKKIDVKEKFFGVILFFGGSVYHTYHLERRSEVQAYGNES